MGKQAGPARISVCLCCTQQEVTWVSTFTSAPCVTLQVFWIGHIPPHLEALVGLLDALRLDVVVPREVVQRLV